MRVSDIYNHTALNRLCSSDRLLMKCMLHPNRISEACVVLKATCLENVLVSATEKIAGKDLLFQWRCITIVHTSKWSGYILFIFLEHWFTCYFLQLDLSAFILITCTFLNGTCRATGPRPLDAWGNAPPLPNDVPASAPSTLRHSCMALSWANPILPPFAAAANAKKVQAVSSGRGVWIGSFGRGKGI